MDPVSASIATASVVGSLASHFMLDPTTFQRGTELGHPGMGFYFAGRGGPLGDVSADVVAAAMVFFHPDQVRAGWEGSRAVQSRDESAEAYLGCALRWAEAHLPEELEGGSWGELAELAGAVSAAASPAGVPLFAAWRERAVEAHDRGRALFELHLLRELRAGLHGAAAVGSGADLGDLVRLRSAPMAGIFGWEGELDEEGRVRAANQWRMAEDATDVAFGRALSVLDEAQLGRFTALVEKAGEART